MKHNNVLPNGHFRKHWEKNVRTWFNQPGRKHRRRMNRLKKAAAAAPRPADGSLRPLVRCPTLRYCTKVRAGRGFSLGEIRAAGLGRLYARSIGIAVDHRRRTISNVNKARLAEYVSKIVFLPKDGSKVAVPAQLPKGSLMPITNEKTVEAAREITSAERQFSAYKHRRDEWTTKRHAGINAKRAAEKAAKEESEKK